MATAISELQKSVPAERFFAELFYSENNLGLLQLIFEYPTDEHGAIDLARKAKHFMLRCFACKVRQGYFA